MDKTTEDNAKGPACPGCNGSLARARVNAHYGRVIVVDQCGSCGGVWFDKWELYSVDSRALSSLHEVDVKSLLAPNPHGKGNGRCPRCARPLVVYLDPALPADAEIKRCGGCSGLWLNRSDIGAYGRYKKTVLEPRAAELRVTRDETARRLERQLKDTRDTIPVDLSGLPSEAPEVPDFSTALNAGEFSTTKVAKDVGYLILASLLRLIVPF